MNKRRGWLTVLALVTALPVAVAQQDKTFIGFWPFTEGTGTNAFDASGNNRTGVLTGWPLPVWTNGVRGGALIFDGLQNDVQVADAPGLTPENALTLAAWVQVATNTTSEVIAKWSTDIASGSYMLALTNGFPALELSLDGDYVCLIGQRGLPDSGWHHLAGTYDGQQLLVYLDGVVVGSGAVTGTVDAVAAPVQLGLVAGQMKGVRIYARALAFWEVGMLGRGDQVGMPVGRADWSVAPWEAMAAVLPVPTGANWRSQIGRTAVAGSSPAGPTTRRVWYIDARAGNNANHGCDQAHAKKDISAALELAGDGDVLVIAAGDYRLTRLGLAAGTLVLQPHGTVRIGNPGQPPVIQLSGLARTRAAGAAAALAAFRQQCGGDCGRVGEIVTLPPVSPAGLAHDRAVAAAAALAELNRAAMARTGGKQ